MKVFSGTTFQIECGTEDRVENFEGTNNFYWQVCKLDSLETCFIPSKSEDYYLVFTSKNAVIYFVNNVLFNFKSEINWLKCKGICTVGESTALTAKKLLPNYFFQTSKNVIYSVNELGLKALLELLFSNNYKLKNEKIIIFTSLTGKTQKTIEDFNQFHSLQYEIVPLYNVSNIDFAKSYGFLQNIFVNMEVSNSRFVFRCKSGHILEQCVLALTQFFCVKNSKDLPSHIYFSIFGDSAKEMLFKFELIDRILP